VDVFQQWQEWRTKHGVQFSNGDRAIYYAQPGFAADFLQFVRLHYIPAASKASLAIATLVDYEAALLGDDPQPASDDIFSNNDISKNNDELFSPGSRPQLLPGVHVVNLPADYQEIVRRLRQKSPLHDIPDQPVKLAVRRNQPGPAEARQLTPLSAEFTRPL